MKFAVTIWDGRVSPLFDVSREALILTVEKGSIVARDSASIEAPSNALKVDRVIALGVDTLVCGAISESLRQDLTARGLEVLGFVAGEVDEVVEALLAGNLPSPTLSMPGCRGKQNRGGQGRGRGRGRGKEQGDLGHARRRRRGR